MGGAGERLAVRRLDLSDFRCYRALRLVLDNRPVVLTGENGAGKTNLLESLSFLAPGRGLRHASSDDVCRYGAGPSWAVAARLSDGDGDWTLSVGREGTRRITHLNGASCSASELGQVVSVLWLTPAMDRLFVDGASGRRRFMDRLTLGQDGGHGRRVAAYERAMRERLHLLREGGGDDSWLSALEDAMVRHGMALALSRRESMMRLDAACSDPLLDRERTFPSAHVRVVGAFADSLAEQGADPFAAWLRSHWANLRDRDAAAGTTTFGPHRDDLEVRHRDKDRAADACSTGEQKAVLISIVLAQAQLRLQQGQRAPILLLDEIAAHLDQRRRRALFDILCALDSQCWMTGTDREVFEMLQDRVQFVHVAQATAELQPEPSPL